MPLRKYQKEALNGFPANSVVSSEAGLGKSFILDPTSQEWRDGYAEGFQGKSCSRNEVEFPNFVDGWLTGDAERQ